MTDPPDALPGFDERDLARKVEALGSGEIDALAFGAIKLARDGTVAFYSESERRASGSGRRPRIGLHFFDEIAPCMSTEAFRGRIERAVAQGTLDLEFGHTGDFDDPYREMAIRVQSAADGGVWIFLDRRA